MKKFMTTLLAIYLVFIINNLTIFGSEFKVNNEEVTIVLDPGHCSKANLETEPISPNGGGRKPKDRGGASGISTKTPEYEINLKVALKLQKLLEDKNYKVIMTKTKNEESLGNIERAKIGNKNNADLVLRIHCDSHKNSAHYGASMLVPKQTNENTREMCEKSEAYGKVILAAMCEEVGIKNRGLIYTDQMTGFNWSKVPVILVEMGFLSNPNEDSLLSSESYQDKLAQGLFSGIEKAFKVE